jgi:hypothetical protein
VITLTAEAIQDYLIPVGEVIKYEELDHVFSVGKDPSQQDA